MAELTTLKFSEQRRSLLSSPARVQVPWIKVTFGDTALGYTFGVFSRTERNQKDEQGVYTAYNIKYPNYIQRLSINKINGQVNQYTLSLAYPVRQTDDPNFFEKIFSSISNTRKITFSYGDMSMPTYIYKDEEAIITDVRSSFDLAGSVINYTVSAVSGASLSLASNITFVGGLKKPSDELKRIFKTPSYGLQNVFTGMSAATLDYFIAGDDKAVMLDTKINISVLDLISYLVSAMVPASSIQTNVGKEIYILTLHDDTTYDRVYAEPIVVQGREVVGPYFKVTKTSTVMDHSDAYEVDIGFNTSTIVTGFSINNNENYSIYFDYQQKLNTEQYIRRIGNDGRWQDVYAPAVTSKNDDFLTRSEDTVWMTKVTQYPISATLTIQGLLRPAQLMTYLRLNVIFPGGHKHISSGLYIITQQQDNIDGSGYRTTLSLTRIAS